jgi:hypothetical protein
MAELWRYAGSRSCPHACVCVRACACVRVRACVRACVCVRTSRRSSNANAELR